MTSSSEQPPKEQQQPKEYTDICPHKIEMTAGGDCNYTHSDCQYQLLEWDGEMLQKMLCGAPRRNPAPQQPEPCKGCTDPNQCYVPCKHPPSAPGADAVLDALMDDLDFLPSSTDKQGIVWITMRDVQEKINERKAALRQQRGDLGEGVDGKMIPKSEDHFMNPDSKHFDPDAAAHDPGGEQHG